MVLDYYYMLASAPCRGPMLTARALRVELNLKAVNLRKGEQLQPEFVKLNPQHVVPTLVDGDFVLWESKAIIGYLVGQYGKDDSLYPRAPRQRALIDRLLYFDMGLHQRFRDWAHPVMKEGQSPDPEKLAKLHEGLAYLDDHIKKQNTRFVAGDNICVADHTLACATATYRALGVSMSTHPNIEAWLQRCQTDMPGYEDICIAGANSMASFVKDLLMAK